MEPEQKHFFFGRDMTERKEAEEQLRHLAHFDQLTGLPNRLSLRDDIDKILKEHPGDPARPMTVAMLDLDGFKDVNDTLGHPVGDRLLQEVARRLTSVSGKRVPIGWAETNLSFSLTIAVIRWSRPASWRPS